MVCGVVYPFMEQMTLLNHASNDTCAMNDVKERSTVEFNWHLLEIFVNILAE